MLTINEVTREFDREETLSIISDIYKSAYGHRPNLSAYSDLKNDELDVELDRLYKIAERQAIEEEEMERQAVDEFKRTVNKLIRYGAGDRATALKWLIDGEDIKIQGEMDIEGFLYRNGILFTSYGKTLKEELMYMFFNSYNYYKSDV